VSRASRPRNVIAWNPTESQTGSLHHHTTQGILIPQSKINRNATETAGGDENRYIHSSRATASSARDAVNLGPLSLTPCPAVGQATLDLRYFERPLPHSQSMYSTRLPDTTAVVPLECMHKAACHATSTRDLEGPLAVVRRIPAGTQPEAHSCGQVLQKHGST
jgi:hypothetical protein